MDNDFNSKYLRYLEDNFNFTLFKYLKENLADSLSEKHLIIKIYYLINNVLDDGEMLSFILTFNGKDFMLITEKYMYEYKDGNKLVYKEEYNKEKNLGIFAKLKTMYFAKLLPYNSMISKKDNKNTNEGKSINLFMSGNCEAVIELAKGLLDIASPGERKANIKKIYEVLNGFFGKNNDHKTLPSEDGAFEMYRL